MIYYVYFVLCKDNSLYCGITNDLNKRIKQHNGEIKGGAKYTLARKPVQIVYTKKAANRSAALKLECYFKKLSRKDKIKLINQELVHPADHPLLHLLEEDL